ncbi:MAG TPA: hypothetical protein VEX43_07140 [Chthoniobacterales bacterium]|nr:hypothetical protein [Chthoniobacterales bacterium]
MSDSPPTRILLVDDESQGALLDNLRAVGVKVDFRLPEEIEVATLCSTDLVLLDVDLGWAASEKDVVDLHPPDGLALAAILRRQTCLAGADSSPTGVALLTGKFDELVAPFPPQIRRHLAARHFNLEWIFSKTDANRVPAIASLASAIHSIPKAWARGIRSVNDVAAFLGIEGANDISECWEAVERCHAPLFEFTQWSHGVAFVRWMLHQILTHPCFLWDSYQVAARLRITHPYFSQTLDKSEAFRERLRPATYTGMLRDFAGPRWWRHRIEALAWDLTNGDPQNGDALRLSLSKIMSEDVTPSSVPRPIVCFNELYQPIEETYAIEDAVRVQPDDWPSYADSAWMPIVLLRDHPHLQPLLLQEDRERFDAYGTE